MASSAKSEKLGLSLWEASDMPERLDFRGDNEALENLVGGHLADATKHLEAAEKQFLKKPYLIALNRGTGNTASNNYYGQINIKAAIVMAVGHAPVEYDANGVAHVYWDFCSDQSVPGNTNIVMGRGGTRVGGHYLTTYYKTLEDGTVLSMNEKGTYYLAIMIPKID